jgi:3',5'-cyclic AMP phosphodiesterase CpdA
MSLLIQISDPHFGTEQPPVVEALVRFVRMQAPDLVVLSGDITQRARKRQFRAARAFVDRLGAPALLAIPGNHDIPLFDAASRLFKPYANFRRAFGHELEPVYESERLLAIALNTTRRYRHANGEVSKAQIERVAARLERASASQLRLVIVHQPVCVTRPEDEENLLRGHQRAVRRWAAAGADLIMGGHIHLPFVRALHERYDGLQRRAWVVQAGTAVSRRVRNGAANSVNLVRYGGPGPERRCAVERWDFHAASAEFARVAVDELRCDAVDVAR